MAEGRKRAHIVFQVIGGLMTLSAVSWFVTWGSIVASTSHPVSHSFWIAASVIFLFVLIGGVLLLVYGEAEHHRSKPVEGGATVIAIANNARVQTVEPREGHPPLLTFTTSDDLTDTIDVGMRLKKLHFREPQDITVTPDLVPAKIRQGRRWGRKVLRVTDFGKTGFSIFQYKPGVLIKAELYEVPRPDFEVAIEQQEWVPVDSRGHNLFLFVRITNQTPQTKYFKGYEFHGLRIWDESFAAGGFPPDGLVKRFSWLENRQRLLPNAAVEGHESLAGWLGFSFGWSRTGGEPEFILTVKDERNIAYEAPGLHNRNLDV